MPEIDQQEAQLFAERLADSKRQTRLVPLRLLGEAQLHFRRFLILLLALDSSASIAASALS